MMKTRAADHRNYSTPHWKITWILIQHSDTKSCDRTFTTLASTDGHPRLHVGHELIKRLVKIIGNKNTPLQFTTEVLKHFYFNRYTTLFKMGTLQLRLQLETKHNAGKELFSSIRERARRETKSFMPDRQLLATTREVRAATSPIG
jgi:hypothetical protein